MARMAIRTKRPTVSEVAVAIGNSIENAPPATWQDVLEAAKKRGVVVKDGRVEARDVAALYFETMYAYNVIERPQ